MRWKGVSFSERFWSRVDKTGDCWLWTGYVDAHGRGSFSISAGHTEKAPRIAWTLTYGPIPAREQVRHRCRNTRCVRPEHLMLGIDLEADAERFWKKVQKTDTCWLWTGGKGQEGYGQFRVGRDGRWVAHRFSYELTYGPIPKGLCILHACDVPSCVNPAHLSVGTQADNIRDRDQKGHASRGIRRHNAKMTDDTVREMRARFAAGGVTQTALADEFGITLATTNKIILRKAWRHVL